MRRSGAKWPRMGVNIRPAAGQQFSRDPMGSKSAEYACLSNAAKQAFRKEWAQQMYTKVVKTTEKDKTWRTVDSKKGSYEPFAIIVQREGGGPAGLRAAANYVAACVRMAGPWISRNPMTKRDEYLYLKRCFTEEFAECWRQYESRSTTGERAEEGKNETARGPPAGKNKAALAGEAFGNAKGRAKAKATDKAHATAGTSPSDKKGSLETAFAAAMDTRKQHNMWVSKARVVLDNVASGGEWEWLLGDSPERQLRSILDLITEVCKSNFARALLSLEPKAIRAKYGQESLLSESLNFANSLEKPLADLRKTVSKVLRMHSESTRDE